MSTTPGITRLPSESKTRYRPSALIQGRKAFPPPVAALATMEVVPAGPQSTLLAGGRVVPVVPPPGTVVSVVPPPGAGPPGAELGGASGAVFCGAAAIPTMARLRRRLPVEP